MKRLLWQVAAFSMLAGFYLPEALRAHPMAPSLLELRESDGSVLVLWKISLLNPQAANLQPLLPPPCRILSSGWEDAPTVERVHNTGLIRRWTYDCGPAGLEGRRIAVEGLERTDLSVLLRAVLGDGRTARTILQPDSTSYLIPKLPTSMQVAGDYLVLGIGHILSGFDHLLFVLGLLLLVRARRALLLTVTAFTLGHSVTLALAALGLVQLPSAPVELAIALSIWILALELTRGEGKRSWAGRSPWRMAALFGLLHGFGFASALAEAGLPQGDIPLALLCFNSGIEVGQLAFIVVALTLQAALGWLLRRGGAEFGVQPLRTPAAYLIGAISTYWCLHRGAALLAAWS